MWTIYYDDGSTAEGSSLLEWAGARQDGVVSVRVSDKVWGGREFYAMLPDGSEVDVYGLDDLRGVIRRYLPWIKLGGLVPTEKYQRMLRKARANKDG